MTGKAISWCSKTTLDMFLAVYMWEQSWGTSSCTVASYWLILLPVISASIRPIIGLADSSQLVVLQPSIDFLQTSEHCRKVMTHENKLPSDHCSGFQVWCLERKLSLFVCCSWIQEVFELSLCHKVCPLKILFHSTESCVIWICGHLWGCSFVIFLQLSSSIVYRCWLATLTIQFVLYFWEIWNQNNCTIFVHHLHYSLDLIGVYSVYQVWW